jgi:hypothetical protein
MTWPRSLPSWSYGTTACGIGAIGAIGAIGCSDGMGMGAKGMTKGVGAGAGRTEIIGGAVGAGSAA